MKIFPKHLAAFASAGVLASASLVASAIPGQRAQMHHDRFVTEIETVLAMTPTQKDHTQTAIDKARNSAQPVREELKTNGKALQAAVRSDDSAQIQRLSTAVGQEVGRLFAIRSEA